MTLKQQTIAETKEEAISKGFLGFNHCPHLCVELGEGPQTISVKLANGRRIEFAFVQMKPEEGDFSCVDIVDDTLDSEDNQQVCVMGRGPTFYSSGKEDAVTVTSITLRTAK